MFVKFINVAMMQCIYLKCIKRKKDMNKLIKCFWMDLFFFSICFDAITQQLQLKLFSQTFPKQIIMEILITIIRWSTINKQTKKRYDMHMQIVRPTDDTNSIFRYIYPGWKYPEIFKNDNETDTQQHEHSDINSISIAQCVPFVAWMSHVVKPKTKI